MNNLSEALKQEREKRNISLEFIATATNIPLNTLSALENEQFSKIPSGIYFKNYIKSYLNAIDADVNDFFETHREALAISCGSGAETANAYCTKLTYSRFKRKNILLVSLAAVVFLGLLVYAVYTKKEAILSSWSGWNKTPVEITTPQSALDFNAHRFQEDSDRDYSPLNAAIEFSEPCWIQVNRGKEKLIEKIFQKGEKLAVAGYELTFLMANPAGVRLLLNGREVSYLRALTKPEKLTITPVTLGKLFE